METRGEVLTLSSLHRFGVCYFCARFCVNLSVSGRGKLSINHLETHNSSLYWNRRMSFQNNAHNTSRFWLFQSKLRGKLNKFRIHLNEKSNIGGKMMTLFDNFWVLFIQVIKPTFVNFIKTWLRVGEIKALSNT